MRGAAFAIVLAALLAGCFGGGGQGGDGDATGTSSGSRSATPSASAGGATLGFTWTPAVPFAGQAVNFTGSVNGLGDRSVEAWSWAFPDANATGPTPSRTFPAGDHKVRLNVLLSDGRALSKTSSVLVLSTGAGAGNGTDAPAPPPPGVFQCGDQPVVEAHATFGSDDALPALAWASLKTGFRFAVAWTSESPATGSLTYTIGNGTSRTVTETVPTRAHLIVVDDLDVGRTMCFTVSMGGVTTALHAVRTANAMTAFEEGFPHGAYTVNTLTLVNELGDVAEVEAGYGEYAARLWDATDGWVRAGANLVVVGDYAHGNLGYFGCYFPVTLTTAACTHVYDVVFSNNADPRGAASTYRQGVRDADVAVWMNQYHQALPGPAALDDTGAVLVHEMGHYLFDMDDLYGDPVIPDDVACDVPSLSMSIMGGPREATEFDDETNPCPGKGSDYVPSWTLMRGQFPQVPDRTTDPLEGPDGDGGLFLLRTYHAV